MAVSKSFQIVDVLNTQQVHSLRKYVLSKTSVETDVYQLLEIAINTRNKRKKNYAIEHLKESYFPNASAKNIGNNLSTLYTYIEDWIVLDQLSTEEYTKDLLIQKWCNSNALYSLADQTLTKIKKSTQTVALDVEESEALSQALFEHLFSSNPGKYDLKANDYFEMLDAFHESTAIHHYILLIELINREEVANIQVKTYKKQIQRQLKYVEHTPMINILQDLYKMIEGKDTDAFYRLKEVLFKNVLKEGSKLHNIITNYVVRRSMRLWSEGKLKDRKVIYDLANYGMTHGIYFTKGRLATATFHNLVSQLCQSSDYKSMLKFIDNWIHQINTKNKESTRGLAKAQVAFYFYKYEEIYPHIQQKDFDFNQKNLAQSLHLVAYFMHRNKDYEAYIQAANHSRLFLLRHKKKMSNHLYQSYQNLFAFMKRLEVGKQGIDLNEYSPLLYRKWCEYLLKAKK